MKYVTAKEIKEMYHISGTTLQRWKDSGSILYKQISKKKILYLIPESDFETLSNTQYIIGFVSYDNRDKEISLINEAYSKQCHTGENISCFYDDHYEHAMNAFDEQDMIYKILNGKTFNIIFSKEFNNYIDPTSIQFILHNAYVMNVNIWIYDKQTKCISLFNNQLKKQYQKAKIIKVDGDTCSNLCNVTSLSASSILSILNNELSLDSYQQENFNATINHLFDNDNYILIEKDTK